MKAGNFSSAAAYAKDALKVDPSNAEALSIIGAARQRKASPTPSPTVRTAGGSEDQVGSAAYLLKYAKHHMKEGAFGAAADYAKQALAVDPSSSEAKQILALAKGRRDKGEASNSCQAQFSTCWVGAQTYTPGSGYKADLSRRQQCMVERNLCNSNAR